MTMTASLFLVIALLLLLTTLLGGLAFVLPTVLVRWFPFPQSEPEEGTTQSPSPAE